MPRRWPYYAGGGTSPPAEGGDVDGLFDDGAVAADALTMQLDQADGAVAADVLSAGVLAVPDGAVAADSAALIAGTGLLPDTTRANDRFDPVSITIIASEDTWLDEANPTTAHGSDTDLISQVDTALGGNEKHWLILWDLTSITSAVWGSPTSATFRFTTQTSGVTGSTANVQIRRNATRPFTASTATWNTSNSPAGSNLDTFSVSFPATAAEQTLAITSPSLALGQWVYLRCVGGTALGLQQENVRSVEHASTATRPTLTLNW